MGLGSVPMVRGLVPFGAHHIFGALGPDLGTSNATTTGGSTENVRMGRPLHGRGETKKLWQQQQHG
jgi:hypothetical protein